MNAVRLVIDTNVLISGLLSPGAVPAELIRHWRRKRFDLVSAEEQVEEIARVTRYPKIRERMQPGAAGELVNELRRLTTWIDSVPALDISPDYSDNYLLGLAQASGAQLLISGDKRDVLAVGTHRGTRIVTAREALELLGA